MPCPMLVYEVVLTILVVPTLFHNFSYSFRVLTSIIFVEIGGFNICRRGSIRIIEKTRHRLAPKRRRILFRELTFEHW